VGARSLSASLQALAGLAVVALVAGAGLAACSSSSEKGGGAEEGGAADVFVVDAPVADSVNDAGAESGDAGADAVVLPDAFIDLEPDGCSLTGASCLDDSTCCSAVCVDGGCTRLPVQQ
jgi:hypothetical protein